MQQVPPSVVTVSRVPDSSPWLPGSLTAIGLVGSVIAAVVTPSDILPIAAKAFMIAWLAVSVLVTFVIIPRNFALGFLGGLLTMLIGWRIAGLYDVVWVTRPLLIAFAAFAAQFVDVWRIDRRRGAASLLRGPDWHLTFLRIFIGFDMVPHFTEKLFAGPGPFAEAVKGFSAMGLPVPAAFVILAGLCELGIAIGVGMGLLTRLAAVCAALYFFIATVIGGHFANGFIWADPGGGWEYPVLMMILYLSFSIRGGGALSLDGVLDDAGRLSPRLRWLAMRSNVRPGAAASPG